MEGEFDLGAMAERFWQQGYVHLPRFFRASLMDQYSALIEAHFGEDPSFEHSEEFLERSATEVVPWFPQREGVSSFDEIDQHAAFVAVTEALLGKAWERQYCMVMFSKAGSSGQAWHQDCPSDGEHFNLNRLIYTSGITDETGGQVVVVPGSHKLGELTTGDPHGNMPGEVILAPEKGDLLLLHGHCWHRVLPVGPRYRFSTNYRAASTGAPEDLTDVCVYRNMRFQFSTSSMVLDRTL